MAFDQPIEADRIDDFNVFSAFVRAPLWILGGMLGAGSRDGDDDDAVVSHRLDDDVVDENDLPNIQNNASSSRNKLHSGDKRGMDWSSSKHHTASPGRRNKTLSLYGDGPPGLKRSKNLSWSDESGKSLVEYNDESVRHEPSPYSSVTSTQAPKPVKSVLRRSGSVRSQSLGTTVAKGAGTRYIPKMTKAHNGLIMPTRPFGSDASAHGGNSPQLGYGFYTNLTPPTPEMYQSHGSRSSKAGSFCSVASTVERTHQNEVFRNLQSNNAQIGWTAMPM